MPAYRTHLEAGDVDALWAYVQWMRSPSLRAPSASQAVGE
jgi:hypothetical protein